MSKIQQQDFHQSQRGYFAGSLFNEMITNKDIMVITSDLGYRMFDKIQGTFNSKFINCGAAEQCMLGMGVGMAMENKIPICYSITPFLLYRGFETIRNYINREKIPVILVGGGRDKDYSNDGFSHHSEDDKKVMKLFPNIKCYWPETKKEIPKLLIKILKSKCPTYLNLTR